jgi:hypothetical protein
MKTKKAISAGFRAGAITSAVAFAAETRAELVWEQASLTMESLAGQANTQGIFKFTNRGAEPVKILNVRATCGCTAAKPDREVIGPGDSSQLTAEISTANRIGLVSVSIFVETDDIVQPTYSLTLNVIITEAVQMTPRLLFWKIGEPATAKRVVLKAAKGVTIVSADVEGGAFSAKLAKGSGDEHVLWVTPRATTGSTSTMLVITARQGDRPLPHASAFLRVVE